MWWEDHSYDTDLLTYPNPMFFYLIRMSLIKDKMPGHTAVSTQHHFLFLFSISSQFSLESHKIFQYLTAFPTLVAHGLSKAKCAPLFSCSGLVQNRHVTYANPIRLTQNLSKNCSWMCFFSLDGTVSVWVLELLQGCAEEGLWLMPSALSSCWKPVRWKSRFTWRV